MTITKACKCGHGISYHIIRQKDYKRDYGRCLYQSCECHEYQFDCIIDPRQPKKISTPKRKELLMSRLNFEGKPFKRDLDK